MRTEFSNTTSGPPSSVRRASTKKKIAKRNYLNEHNTSKKKLVDKLLRRKNKGLQTNQLVNDFLVNLKLCHACPGLRPPTSHHPKSYP